jgi:hypothetical protein
MATEISNGSQTVKLYQSVNRGKAMYQLAYYMGGRRVQKNFADKAQAKRVAKQILGGLTNDAEAVEALATPELESLVAARRVLAPNYALHVAVEEHAQAVGKLGQISLREAVEFFLRHNRADVPRLTLAEIAEQFAKSREQSGLSAHYVSQCRKTVNDLAKAFPGKTLPDLRTAELDAWLGGLTFGAKTKNGMRIILVACGNWAEGRGYPTVRLYLDDKLIGEKASGAGYDAEFTLPYQPGVLKVAGVDGGKEVESYQLKTVGAPVALRLTPDRATLHADAQDISFVQVEVVDKDGQIQPNADDAVHFALTGPGTIAGLGSALLKGTEPYQGTDCHVFHGRALVVLRSSHQAGTLELHAEAPGLAAAETKVLAQ